MWRTRTLLTGLVVLHLGSAHQALQNFSADLHQRGQLIRSRVKEHFRCISATQHLNAHRDEIRELSHQSPLSLASRTPGLTTTALVRQTLTRCITEVGVSVPPSNAVLMIHTNLYLDQRWGSQDNQGASLFKSLNGFPIYKEWESHAVGCGQLAGVTPLRK